MGWGSPSLPLWAHLLKVGIPLLGRDDKLDPFTHVVLKLTGGKEEVGREQPAHMLRWVTLSTKAPHTEICMEITL